MSDVQERVALVEGRLQGQQQMLTDVVQAVRHLEARMEQRFVSVDLRFTAIDNRFTALEAKLDQKIDVLEARTNQKFDVLEAKIDSHFRWLVGIQFAVLIAIVTSFLAG